MYAQVAIKPNPLLRNGAYGIVMRGVQKCTRGCSSLRGRNKLPLCCIKLDTATEIAHRCGQFSVGTSELTDDDLCNFRIGLCDFYRILKTFFIIPHKSASSFLPWPRFIDPVPSFGTGIIGCVDSQWSVGRSILF